MKKKLFAAGALAAFTLSLTPSAFAFSGKDISEESRTEIRAAIEVGDFTAWSELMSEIVTPSGKAPKILEVVTADNFERFSQMHDYRQKAREIAEELGIERGGKMGHGKRGMNRGGFDAETRKAYTAAIEVGDYEAWAELVADSPRADILEVITADNFDRFVELHAARQSGDSETAEEIAAEIGLPDRPERPEFESDED